MSMDFFKRQDDSRRNTKWLVCYFGLGVAAVTVCIYLVCVVAFSGVSRDRRHRYAEAQPIQLWRPELFLWVSGLTVTVIGIASFAKIAELSQGGGAVASSLGGRLVNSGTTDPHERKLLNIVEEMAIASGIPVPQVYVLPSEDGINAFAAGNSPSDAAVAVTSGALRVLSRDELQGVIAHEFSHILNGDMRLNLRLMGVVFGIMCIAVIGRILLEVRSGGKDKNPLPFVGLALLIIGWLGVFFGRLIQAGVSRQREFLADASAVQFTRNPLGLAGALKKIGGWSSGSRVNSPHADEACHLFFGGGRGSSLFGFMDTHPPLEARIKALDPEFNGVFEKASASREETGERHGNPAGSRVQQLFQSSNRATANALAGSKVPNTPPVIVANGLFSSVGNPEFSHLRFAARLQGEMSPLLRSEVRDSLGAASLTYALLLSEDAGIRLIQLQRLKEISGPEALAETERLQEEVSALAANTKLPLVDLAVPALRLMSKPQFDVFVQTMAALIEADEQVDLFEFMLQKMVVRHVQPHFDQQSRAVIEFYALRPLVRECGVILSALAYAGQGGLDNVSSAFQRGAETISQASRESLFLEDRENCELTHIDQALNRLSRAVPQIRKLALQACMMTVAADGVVTELEAELLRAIADTIDCPLPPAFTGSSEEV